MSAQHLPVTIAATMKMQVLSAVGMMETPQVWLLPILSVTTECHLHIHVVAVMFIIFCVSASVYHYVIYVCRIGYHILAIWHIFSALCGNGDKISSLLSYFLTFTCAVEYTIQLVGGGSSLEGRIEVYINGTWGTVCDDSWDINDATVVCQQLGYGSAVSARMGAYFGQGSGDIVLDDVACTGLETNIRECSASTSHNCVHHEDAGVVCSGNDGDPTGIAIHFQFYLLQQIVTRHLHV